MYKSVALKDKQKVITIMPGEYYVTNRKEVISTVLGSCISVCLFDKVNMVSGINHFMLPKSAACHFSNSKHEFLPDHLNDQALRYGLTSMEILINKMVKIGGEKKHFTAKVFGGGNVLPVNGNKPTVGEQNIEFILSFLKMEGISILSQDLGKRIGRKIMFFTHHNSVYVKPIPITRALTEEEERRSVIHKKDIPHAGEIELFN